MRAPGAFTARIAGGTLDAMGAKDPEPLRIIILMNKRLIDQIDDFRFEHRMTSRAEAIRQLIKAGLQQSKERRPRQ